MSTPEKTFVPSTFGETGNVAMQEYTMLIGLVHVALDGIGAHMIQQQILSLLGGRSSASPDVPWSEAELFCVLSDQWESRFGPKRGNEPVWILPPSLNDRLSTPNTQRDINIATRTLQTQPHDVVSPSFFHALGWWRSRRMLTFDGCIAIRVDKRSHENPHIREGPSQKCAM